MEIYNNQILTSEEPDTGAYQPKPLEKPTWTDIIPEDLKDDARSKDLWQEAIQRGHLKNIQSDRINFYAAIAHALRVATTNTCGLFRTIVEKGLWNFITQADEYNAIQRLTRSSEAQETKQAQRIPTNPFLTASANEIERANEQRIELSKDALIVQTLTADLKHVEVSGDVFRTVKRYGHLRDWDKERWERAEQELAQARLLQARQRCQEMEMTSIGNVIEEDTHKDEPPDGG